MININLTTNLTESECIAQLRYIKPTGEEHRRTYTCERYAADSSQRAELKALAAGLREIRCPAKVMIHMESNHLMAAIRNDWPKIWKQNGWKNQKGNLVRDWELWKEVIDISEKKQLVLTGRERT